MKQNIEASFFVANRQRLRKLIPHGVPVIIGAHGQVQKAADACYAFQQDANFWYLTGIDEPDVQLVINGKEEYLITPASSAYQQIFDGTATNQELTKISGVATVLPVNEVSERLKSLLLGAEQVGILEPNAPFLDTYGMYTNPSRAVLKANLQSLAGKELSFIDVRPLLAELRVLKQPQELAAMKKAIAITIEAFEELKNGLPEMHYEYEAEAVLMNWFIKNGAREAWRPIVGAGPDSCVLHSRDNRAPMKPGDVVVIDIGAEWQHYCSDITRTFMVAKRPTKRQQAVYDAVLKVQDYALSLVKPGALIKENELKVETFMGKQLCKLGLFTTASTETIRHFYPHATSHFLGIDPHDAGDYTKPLAPGMVITIEPGIYISDERIGVRIEDDILVTETGYENLSHSLPRQFS